MRTVAVASAETLLYELPALDGLGKGFAKTACSVYVFVREAFATLRYVLPLSMMWLYKKHISQEISESSLQVTADKGAAVASLYLHNPDAVSDKGKGCAPVLLVHGDYGYPFSLLHLAEAAKQHSQGPVFSLYIPNIHDNDRLASHSALVDQAIGKIEQCVHQTGGIFQGVRGVGHSKGAILLAERQFVHLDPRIAGVFAIGGRLNVPEGDTSCSERLKPFVQNIFKAIRRESAPVLFQIIPEEDWNAPREAMAVRPHRDCYTVPGLHLSGLYTDKVVELFHYFMNVTEQCSALQRYG